MPTAMADARTALFGLGNGRTADAFQCTAVDGRKLLCGLQERHRVHRAPIDAHFIMKMASGGPAGGTHAGDHVAALHLSSEEHTSELQALMRIPYAVFRLKKKQH